MTTRSLKIFALILLGVLGVAFAPAADEPPHPRVAVTLKGHTEMVYAIGFTPDGNQVVTAAFDNSLKLWDTASGKEIKSFIGPQGHQSQVLCLSISPDGQLLASGGNDNTVKIWDIPSKNHLREIVHPDGVNSVALSVDGTKLATACKDGTVQLWNTADGKQLFVMKGGHTGPVNSVSFAANGLLLASCGADKQICYWNPTNGQLIASVLAHAGAPTAVAINPANPAAVYSAGDDGLLKFWQVPPVAVRALPAHADAVTTLTASADGNTILTASADKTVIVSAFANGQQQRQLTGAVAPIQSLAFAPNATTTAGGTTDGKLFLWGAADVKPVSQSLAHTGSVNAVSFHPQSTQLLTAGQDGLLKVWSLLAPPARSLAHPDNVLSGFLTIDAKRLITGSNDKMVRSWNLTNNQMERQFTGHTGPVSAVALSPNAQILVSGGDNTIRFWNQTNGQQTDLIGAHAGSLTSLSFNPNGQQLLSSSDDGTIKLWQTPVTPAKVLAHGDQVTSAVLSPDGTRLLTGCVDKQARVWNIASGQAERAFPGNTLAVNCVAYSANGATIAAGGADKSIIVWNAADAKELKKIAAPAAVQSIVFNPAGTQLVAGLADNSIKVYDVAQGTEVKSLAGHVGPVTALLYTPKGDEILSASADKTVQRWNAADFANKGKLDHTGPLNCLAVNKESTKVAAAGVDKIIKLWTLADNKPAETITTPAEVKGLSFAPDGLRIAVAGADNRARLFNLDGTLAEYFSHDGPVLAVAYHVGGKNIASVSADKTARYWTTSLVWQAKHAGPVRQAMFSPKADRVLSGSDDKTLKLWNAADGKEAKSIPHDAGVVGVGISTDGVRCVAASADKTVKVWTTAPTQPGEKPIAAFTLPSAPQAVSLAPAGTRVAVSFADQGINPIKVFDIAGGKELLTLTDHAAPTPVLAFHTDNRTLLSGGADKTARVLDVGVLSVLEAHPGGVVGAAYHNNGTQAITAGVDKTVKLWDLTTGKEVRNFGTLADPISSVNFNRDYTQVTATAGKNAKVWNLADGKEVLALTSPADMVSLSVSVDKTKIATGCADNHVRIWDVATAKELQAFRHTLTGAVRGVYFHPTNTTIVSGSTDKSVAVNTISAQRVVPAGSPIRGLTAVPNGTHVMTACDDKTVKLWNVTNGAAERVFAGAEGVVNAVAVSKNLALVAAAGADQQVRIYNFADAKQLAVIKAAEPVSSLTFSPNNLVLAAGGAQKTIATWNVTYTPGQPVAAEFGKAMQIYEHAAPVMDLTIAPDNSTIYSASADQTAKLWKIAADLPSQSLAHPQRIDCVAFSPNGQMLATGCADGQLRTFDIPKKTVLKAVAAHTVAQPQPKNSPIYALAWSADGKQIVTASEDKSLKLWDAVGGTLVKEFKAYKEKEFEKGHTSSVFAVAISPDGKFLYSGGNDRSIKVWNTADGAVVRELTNPNVKPRAGQPPQAHPGAINALRLTPDGKYLVAVGGAPPYKGYLSVWNTADGAFLHGEEIALGVFNSLAVAPTNKLIGVACANHTRVYQKVDTYLLKMPEVVK